jgi:hypothetical protein
MLITSIPSTTLPSGYVVMALLTLPASWRDALMEGKSQGLSDAEHCVVVTVQDLFGYCIECTDTPVHADDHDVAAEGIPPAPCLVYKFVDHENTETSREG